MECGPVVDGAPIRQGDIFIFRNAPTDDVWQKAGVIVTADCDIANNKHGGILSYVPIMPLRDYLAWRIIPRIAGDRRKRTLRQMSEMIARLEEDLGIRPGLSLSAIEVLATVDGGLRDLDTHLGGVKPKDAEALAAMVHEVGVCGRVQESSNYNEQFAALTSIYQSSKRRSADEVLLSDVRDRLKNLPGDVFFISSLDQENTGGYVAYLRLIRETHLRQISTSYYHKDGRSVVASRTSRLRAPYVYRLTQQMADVFAAIGLPEEYEAARNLIFESRLAPEPKPE
ncbi:hypothetical protein JD81_01717 [Micromonospora sagamiensis]|uniref:Uncharacterized protein n=2 Tax=Micromonospora sagamiensis TaxID=47875 RepID=A0A562WF84_9ACTN|nr:hypothetical protein JD81_01717 [Micromonospora sagamiensis]